MKESRKTLLVLTSNFVKTEWCKYVAGYRFEEEFKNRILVVQLEECNISKSLRQYIHGVEILKYGEPPGDFYRTLQFFIDHDIDTSTSSSFGRQQHMEGKKYDTGTEPNNDYYGEQFKAALSDANYCSQNNTDLVDKAVAEGSLCSFNKDPESYVERMNKMVENSPNYLLHKKSLRKAMLSQNLNWDILAVISCIKDADLKEIALKKLEGVLLENDPLSDEQANDRLLEAAVKIELSLFSETNSNFLTKRLSVYGCLLTCILLHVWQQHIYPPSHWLSRLGEKVLPFLEDAKRSKSARNKRQKYTIDFCLFVIRSLRFESGPEMQDQWKVFHKFVTSDDISHHTINWKDVLGTHLMNKNSECWFYFIKVILQAFTGLQARKKVQETRKRSFACLPLHAMAYMLKKFKPNCLYHEETILQCAQILSRMACQPKNEMARSVVFGCTEAGSPDNGLRHLFDTVQESKYLKEALSEVIRPILSTSEDQTIKTVLLEKILPRDCRTEEKRKDLVMTAIVEKLTEHYTLMGQSLAIDLKPQLSQAQNDIFRLDGKLNGNPVTAVILNTFKCGDVSQIKKEEKLIKKLTHKNIPKLVEKMEGDGIPFHFITERAKGENLQTFLLQKRKDPDSFPLPDRMKLATGLCETLHYTTHSECVLRNLSAQTIMIMKDARRQYQPKIVNFQQALTVQGGKLAPGTMRDKIPVRCSAPEAFLKNEFSEKTEVYMFGCLLLEIFTLGSPAFQELAKPEDVQIMVGCIDYKVKKPQCIPSDIFNVILACLSRAPDKRPSFGAIRSSLQDILNKAKAQKRHDPEENGFPRVPMAGDFLKRTEEIVTKVSSAIKEHKKWMKGRFAANLKVTTFPTPQKSVERCLLECKKRAKLVSGKGLREHLPPDPALVKVLRSLVSFGNENRNLAAISFPTDGDLNESCFGTFDQNVSSWKNRSGSSLSGHLVHTRYSEGLLASLFKAPPALNRMIPKITNFGRCKHLHAENNAEGSISDPGVIPADFEWYPIEILLDLDHPYICCKTSSYMLAMLCWQMFNEMSPKDRRRPFGCEHVDEVKELLLKKITPEQPTECPEWLYLWMKKAWRDLSVRPALKTLIAWLKSREKLENEYLKIFKNATVLNAVTLTAQKTCTEDGKNTHDSTDRCLEEAPEYYLQGLIWFKPTMENTNASEKSLLQTYTYAYCKTATGEGQHTGWQPPNYYSFVASHKEDDCSLSGKCYVGETKTCQNKNTVSQMSNLSNPIMEKTVQHHYLSIPSFPRPECENGNTLGNQQEDVYEDIDTVMNNNKQTDQEVPILTDIQKSLHINDSPLMMCADCACTNGNGEYKTTAPRNSMTVNTSLPCDVENASASHQKTDMAVEEFYNDDYDYVDESTQYEKLHAINGENTPSDDEEPIYTELIIDPIEEENTESAGKNFSTQPQNLQEFSTVDQEANGDVDVHRKEIWNPCETVWKRGETVRCPIQRGRRPKFKVDRTRTEEPGCCDYVNQTRKLDQSTTVNQEKNSKPSQSLPKTSPETFANDSLGDGTSNSLNSNFSIRDTDTADDYDDVFPANLSKLSHPRTK
ncbi:uncharacterized protein LOC106156661 [Lingula anatina]|uniref:Uncharacterized protein LOC106156661 n=1 Tax=Lingula anatina TaxID=7574 RepID=A0A1S3HPJ1_LINAN|nr:uncharacterized protein LOC106156661 [Lingula anatina]|eukprot:XP_013387461.1 uncharacterized protein LOC106156661 [Lingula anatina]